MAAGLARFWPGTAPLDDAAGVGTARLAVEWAAIMAQTFSLHLAACLAPVLLLALGTRRRAMALISLAAAAMLAWPESVAAIHRASARPSPGAALASPAPGPEGDVLTILSANVLVWERDERPLLALIEANAPDLVLFQEWTAQWEGRAGSALDARYPYRFVSLGQGAFGQRISSLRPFVGTPEAYPVIDGRRWLDPQVRVRVDLAGAPATFQCAHLLAPTWRNRFAGMREQRTQVRGLAAWSAGWSPAQSGPLLIIGDYNFTPRTAYGAMMREAGMQEAHDVAGRGRGASWCRLGTLRHVPGIRIDQCYSKGVVVESSRVLGDIGSDHSPVLFKVRAAPRGGG